MFIWGFLLYVIVIEAFSLENLCEALLKWLEFKMIVFSGGSWRKLEEARGNKSEIWRKPGGSLIWS